MVVTGFVIHGRLKMVFSHISAPKITLKKNEKVANVDSRLDIGQYLITFCLTLENSSQWWRWLWIFPAIKSLGSLNNRSRTDALRTRRETILRVGSGLQHSTLTLPADPTKAPGSGDNIFWCELHCFSTGLKGLKHQKKTKEMEKN